MGQYPKGHIAHIPTARYKPW